MVKFFKFPAMDGDEIINIYDVSSLSLEQVNTNFDIESQNDEYFQIRIRFRSNRFDILSIIFNKNDANQLFEKIWIAFVKKDLSITI